MAASLDDIRLDQPASEIPERQDAADAPEFNQPSINDQLTIQLIEDKKQIEHCASDLAIKHTK